MTVAVQELRLVTHRGTFHALAAGAPSAPLTLVLHGFPDAPPTFVPLLQALAARGHRVVAPWLRGYAPSVLDGPYDVETLAADVAAWLERLGPAAPVRLVGHDWGALAVYAACALHSDRVAAAVTLSVPHPFAFLRALGPRQLARSWYMLWFQLPGAPASGRAGDFALIDWLWRQWSPGLRLPEDRRRAVHRCLTSSWPAPALYYRAIVRPPRAALARLSRRSPLARRLATPTLYLHGARDGCIGPEVGREAGRYFEGPYEREVVPDTGHFLAAERPEYVAERADAWFRQHG